MASHRQPPTLQPALTPREAAILPHILLCTKKAAPARMHFDWDSLVERLHMKNPRSAANAWLAVRKKIEASVDNSSSTIMGGSGGNKFSVKGTAQKRRATKSPVTIGKAGLVAMDEQLRLPSAETPATLKPLS